VIEAVDAGVAWEPHLGGSNARVLAVFSKATYLQFDTDVVAIVTTDVPRGPLHLRVHQLPRVKVGQSFFVEPIILPMAHSTKLGEGSQRCWTPTRLDGNRLLRSRPRLPSADASALAGTATVRRASQALNDNDLLGAVSQLAGLGPGLTPSGDDVLAGILLVASLTERFSPSELRSAADHAPTHDISRSFLRWAANGHSIEPVHDLLSALASGHRTRDAEQAVASIGATSGHDLLLGLRLALCQPRSGWVS
jgi:Protein of unknown function (DUF2877)